MNERFDEQIREILKFRVHPHGGQTNYIRPLWGLTHYMISTIYSIGLNHSESNQSWRIVCAGDRAQFHDPKNFVWL